MKLNKIDLKEFLDEKVELYNNPKFIETDPIQIPHQFSMKEDIEISSFLVSSIAWGNRKMIIKNGFRIIELMGNSPYDFVLNHKEGDLENLNGFVHRTFNDTDFKYFIKALKNIYTKHNGLETVFITEASTLQQSISEFKKLFFEIEHHYYPFYIATSTTYF